MIKKIPLKELCLEDEWGKYGIPASAEDYDCKKTRYLRITDISEDGELLNNDKKSVSAIDVDKYLLKDGDIVFARTGNSTGKTYYHEDKNGKLAFAGFLIKYALDNTKINPKYIKFFTITNEYKNWVKNLSVGSTRGNINAQTFGDCPISVPERKQQDLLVRTLSLIIDKIELNNKINTELEAMAKTLYDYWFVQFDFPNAKGKPYKTSGGKMVWNEELKREIPEGWEVKCLGDCMRIIRGASPRPIDDFMAISGAPWIKISDATAINHWFIIETKEFIKEIGVKHSRELKPGTLILSNSASPGIPRIVQLRSCVHDGWLIVDDFQNGLYNEFMLFYFENFRSKILNMGSGSIFKNLKTEYIKDLRIVLPPDYLLIKSKCILENIALDILNNVKQNQKLTELRDWLLPMLMNGQVKVG